jgi:hypothetical protein
VLSHGPGDDRTGAAAAAGAVTVFDPEARIDANEPDWDIKL